MHKAILFEARRVLVTPVSGHWYMPPDFFEHVKPDNFERIHDIERDAAFALAVRQLDYYPRAGSLEEEYEAFLDFYQTFFRAFPRLPVNPQQIESIARGMVYDLAKFSFLPEASEGIPLLAGKCKVAVLADDWPSLEGVFAHAGMSQHFSAFILSRQLGMDKSNPLLFQAALDALGVSPEEALYVDDSKENCDAALSLGLRTALVCRDRTEYRIARLIHRRHQVIRSLTELLD